jgi:23S rRNA (adenine2503-C2)-methyltransferase
MSAAVKKSLSDFNLVSLRETFSAWGFKTSHAGRLLNEFYNTGGVPDLDALLLGKPLRARFASEIVLRQANVKTRHVSSDGTVKFLLGLEHGGAVETVLMPTVTPGRVAGCVSSQIGCAMGCDFCASTKRGLERDLSAGEIVEQFLHLREEALRSKNRLATLVFMGMGEPLQNLDNVIDAIHRIAAPEMGQLGAKQISVSTVGIVPGIERLTELDLGVTLALSLHAPDDETRSKIVPMNKRYAVSEIIAATKLYYEKTGRITNIEYCLLSGVNDSDAHAQALGALLKGFRTHVNLIPYNSIGTGLSGAVYQQPSAERIDKFAEIVRQAGLLVHLRKTRGDDVSAACGQLREIGV